MQDFKFLKHKNKKYGKKFFFKGGATSFRVSVYKRIQANVDIYFYFPLQHTVQSRLVNRQVTRVSVVSQPFGRLISKYIVT